jgi:hypothetical protein
MGLGWALVSVFVFFIAPITILITTLKLSVRRCNLLYFIVDTIFTGFIFVYGSVHSWDFFWSRNSYQLLSEMSFEITIYWVWYMLLRFVVILIFSIIMRMQRKNIIAHSIKTRVLIAINILLNIGNFIGTGYQFFRSLSRI